MRKICSLLLCVLFLIQPVMANSAMTYWVGVDAQGLISRDSDCPIVVEHEELTLDIMELPLTDYDTDAEFLAYNATATAQYTFYNPSDYAVTARLAFPFGLHPNYSSDFDSVVDWEKYGASADGAPVETTLRCTLELPYDNSVFDVEAELGKLVDGYRTHEFYSPDMPVTRYVYQAKNVNFDEYEPVGRITVSVDPDTTRYLFSYGYFHNGLRRVENGETFIQKEVWLEPGYTTELYMIGAQTELPQWEIVDGEDSEKSIDGTMELLETETMTLEELIFSYYPEDSGILRTDWYNAVLDDLDRNLQENGHTGSSFLFEGNAVTRYPSYFIYWYSYEITLEPGQRMENTVVVPFYPDIDTEYEPAVYKYTYLLSPASTWSDFGTLDIRINTPFYMVGEQPFDFEKTDSGYTVALDGLPEGELEFTLSTVSEPEAPKFELTDLLYVVWWIFALIYHHWWLLALILLGWYVVIRLLRKEK